MRIEFEYNGGTFDFDLEAAFALAKPRVLLPGKTIVEIGSSLGELQGGQAKVSLVAISHNFHSMFPEEIVAAGHAVLATEIR